MLNLQKGKVPKYGGNYLIPNWNAIDQELFNQATGDPVYTDENGVKHWVLPFLRFNPLNGRPYVRWTDQLGNPFKLIQGNLDLNGFLQMLNLQKGKVPKYGGNYLIPNWKVEVKQTGDSVVYIPLKGDMPLGDVFDLVNYDFRNDKALHKQFAGEEESIIITDYPINELGLAPEGDMENNAANRYYWAEKYSGYKYIKNNFEYFLKGSGTFDHAFDSVEDARVLHYLYKYVISPVSQEMLKTFDIHNSNNKLNKPKLIKLLENNFKKYWVTQLEENAKTKLESANLEEKWNNFVEKLFSDIFDERLFASSKGRIDRTIENRLSLLIFSKILFDESIDIDSNDLDVKSLPNKLSEFISDPVKVRDVFRFFQQEEGKTLFLNSFTETFLKSPKDKKLMVPNLPNSYFGWTSEMLYLYNDLPTRLAFWFADNPEVSTYSGIEYSKDNPEFIDITNKLLNLDISGINFPKSSRWFDLNVFNFLSTVISHHMKTVMVSSKNKGVIDTTKRKNLAADSISSLIVDFWKQAVNSINMGETGIILPPRVVELLAPIFRVDKELTDITAKTEAKAIAEDLIKTMLGTNYRDLFTGDTWKVPEEHLFLFDVATLINSEFEGQTITTGNLATSLRTLFDKPSFEKQLSTIIDKIYRTQEKRQFIKNQGIEFRNSIRDLFVNNINKLTTRDSSGNIKIFLNGYYNFYVSTGKILTGEDLLGHKNTYLFDSSVSGYKREITSATEFNSAMMVGHDDNDNIWIISEKDINSLPNNIHEGFIDEEGQEHHNLYVSNNKGIKLEGAKYFEKGIIITKSIESLVNIYESIRKSKQQLDENGDYINIPIFSSNFFAAYGFASGNNYISAIQEVTVNIEHIKAHKAPLPGVTISHQGVNIKNDPALNPIAVLEPESEISLAFLSNFLHQLYGQFDPKNPERNNLHVFDSLLQLQDSGRELFSGQQISYSREYFKDLITALSPTEAQLKKIVQYYVELDSNNKETLKPVKLIQKEFYKTLQTLLKNAKDNYLIRGTLSSTVLNNDISSGNEINSQDDKIIHDLNLALQDLLGDVGTTLLKAGLMSFKVKDGKVVDLDFRKHTKRDMAKFLNRFNMKPLYSYDMIGGERYLEGKRSTSNYLKSLEVYASLLISGYRETFEIDGKTKHRFNSPQKAFGNELFDIYLDNHYKRSYHENVMTKFLDNHFSKYVVLKNLKSSRGISENILTGRQIMFKELVETIEHVLNLKPMPTKGAGTDLMKRKVALYYLMPQFLHEFYLIPQSTQTIDWRSTHYFGELRKMILSGTSSELVYGNAKIVNPLFHIDKTNPVTGLHIPFNPSRFSDSELLQILWTLDYHELYSDIKPEFLIDHKKLENIWAQVKDPIKNTYDRLYDILFNSPETEFTFRFYEAHSTGIDQNKQLKSAIPSGSRGLGIKDGTSITISLDRADLDSKAKFRETVLSAVHYLAKYPYSYMVLKNTDKQNMLYASLTEILDHEFVKTSFSSSPNVIGGSLSSYATSNYESWKNDWNIDSNTGKTLWTILNMYPIYLFSDANSNNFGTGDFAEVIINFFKGLTGDKYEGINEIHMLK